MPAANTARCGRVEARSLCADRLPAARLFADIMELTPSFFPYSTDDIRDILAEARLLLAAAIEAPDQSETEQETAKGGALGAPDARNGKLNHLYDTAIAIQNAAPNEFTTRETQTAFRIGIFPPKQRPKSDGETTPPAPTP